MGSKESVLLAHIKAQDNQTHILLCLIEVDKEKRQKQEESLEEWREKCKTLLDLTVMDGRPVGEDGSGLHCISS